MIDELKEIDEQVYNCSKCDSLVDKFPNSKTYYLGFDNSIVLVGEAPANNGWRKSHNLWKDINGKVLPSGVVLQKLFDIINRDIFDTTFIEAVKCYPLKRSSLSVCSHNCKDILDQQLEVLKPKIVITLGVEATKILLGHNFTKFKDVVGKLYDKGDYQVLPIYHPSPVSPLSLKGNIPIFEELKNYLENMEK